MSLHSTPTIRNLLCIYPIAFEIFGYMEPVDIIRLSTTMPLDVKLSCNDYLRIYPYNINRHLSYFFDKPEEFRILQANTHTIISGSFALQFFTREFYPESDLDIYTPGYSRMQVGNWLLANGYEFVPRRRIGLYIPRDFIQQETSFYEAATGMRYALIGQPYLETVHGVFDFFKTVEGGRRKVQLIVVKGTPVETVLKFHSSTSAYLLLFILHTHSLFLACVMNIITADTAYCLYPAATLIRKRSLKTKYLVGDIATQYLKYGDRGWTIENISHSSPPPSMVQLYQYGSVRWLGDPYTFRFQLSKVWTRTVSSDMVHSESFWNEYVDPIKLTGWSVGCYSYHTAFDSNFSTPLLGGLKLPIVTDDGDLKSFIHKILYDLNKWAPTTTEDTKSLVLHTHPYVYRLFIQIEDY